ncbi:hypothetical protein HLB23_08945 [Nocardia uniformis]|uniref:Uncharacterized protein n=1 Tax=Nocardia uniformis TaxID=53432 RepID=A0A849BXP1_9NOCA|nr:hypothetical protein [Nocardia uniformis]NNH69988.1 hypothetical protein [Nocardia uniformis]
MVTFRNCQRSARRSTVFAAMGAAVVFAAAPSVAASIIDVTTATPSSVEVEYTCAPSAGVKWLMVKVGAPHATQPAASGEHDDPTCDGTPHSDTVSLTGAAGQEPLHSGAVVQVQVAMVDGRNDLVYTNVKLLNLE